MEKYITVAALMLTMTCKAFAESNRLEQVTVIGSQATQNAELGGTHLTRLPLSVFVVSREEIERIRFVDPDDFLDRIPGETQVRNLRIPNGGKPYTLPLVDGMPLEDPYSGATSDINRVNSFDIERIEIMKGPASALYANNAFGGVINVVTREIPDNSQSRVWAEAGDFGDRRAGLNSGGPLGEKAGYFIDINTQGLDGLRDNYQAANPNNFPDAVKNDRHALSGKIHFLAGQNTRFTFRYEHLQRDEVTATDIPQAEFDLDPTRVLSNRAGNPDVSFVEAESDIFYGKAQHDFNAGQLHVHAILRDANVEGDGRFSDPQIENQESVSAKLWYRHDFRQSNLILGTENFSGDIHANIYAGNDLALSGAIVDRVNTESGITAGFTQYTLNTANGVDIIFGLRYEDIRAVSLLGEASFNDLAPKLGLTYQASQDHMLWLGFSEGFLAPSPEDLFDPQEGNPALIPEEAENRELGARGEFGPWRYNTSYYHTDITNYLFSQEVDISGDGELDAVKTSNAAQVSVEGVESVLEFRLSDTWRLGITHTYAKNTFDAFVQSTPGADDDFSGNPLSRSPRHHINTRIAVLPFEGLILELEGDFYSSYTTSDANDDPLGSFKRRERIDLRVNYEIGRWTMWLNGLNLTDTLEDRVSYNARADERRFRLINGRTYQLGLSVEL